MPTPQELMATGQPLPGQDNETTQSRDRENMVKKAQQVIESAQAGSLDQQMQAINDGISILYQTSPNRDQQEALHQLIFRREDLILISKPSFERSMIQQAVSVLLKDLMTIYIFPLDMIGYEQEAWINRIGGKPCLLNQETVNSELLQKVHSRCFSHILMSPEVAVTNEFRKIAISPDFKDSVGLVVVDEAHLAAEWKDSRPAYSRIDALRSFFWDSAPWLACSETLHSTRLRELRGLLSFGDDAKIQRTPIDRPEVLLRLGWIPRGTEKKYTALRFLFCRQEPSEEPLLSPRDVPKTIVFFDSRLDAHRAQEACRHWLANAAPRYDNKSLFDSVKVFHRNTAKTDKNITFAELQKPGRESSIRVVMAAEAPDLVLSNLPDVRRVVIYGIPKSVDPALLWQQTGRASRFNHLPGESIILLDSWAKGERADLTERQRNCLRREALMNPKDTAPSPEEADKERRDTLPDFWYTLCNSDRCLRHQLLDCFDEPVEFRSAINKERCCSNCNNDEYGLRNLDDFCLHRERVPLKETPPMRELKNRLREYAASRVDLVYADAIFPTVPEMFIDPRQLDRLARAAPFIRSCEDMNAVMGSWYFYNTHGEELFEVLQEDIDDIVSSMSNRY